VIDNSSGGFPAIGQSTSVGKTSTRRGGIGKGRGSQLFFKKKKVKIS